jgi:ribosomal protein S24E
MSDYWVCFEAEMMCRLEHEGDDRPSKSEYKQAIHEALLAGNQPDILVITDVQPA